MMTFKELKAGYPIYLLTKNDGLKFQQGKVISVSQPYFQPNKPGTQITANQPYCQLVDVTIKDNESTKTYTMFESSHISESPTGVIISTERESIIKEVESIKAQAEEAISKIDMHKANLASCDSILEQLNPVLAEKREQDKRIEALENRFSGFENTLSEISANLKSLIS